MIAIERFPAPVDTPMNHDYEIATMWVTGVLAATVVVAAIVWAVRQRSLLIPAILAGGAVCTLNEPIADAPARIYHFGPGSHHLYTMLDRPMPVWIFFAYILFYGALPAMIVLLLKRGASYRQVWAGIGIVFISNMLIEIPLTGPDKMYDYYGYQPFSIGNWSTMQLVNNGTAILLAAGLIACLPQAFAGWRALLAVPLMPVAQVVGLAAGTPGYWVLNSDVNHLTMWIGVGAALVLGAFVMDQEIRVMTRGATGNVRSRVGAPTTESRHRATLETVGAS
ncbi:hypothetical protein [Sporichthya sp.]|uniref:hypothetical protein n=1 Tax=Sporichthya sp. TaxID=65475 RepID=UPI0017B6E2C0|nr:hypothetical protein [Sporichthya sp.]MBA3741374.1 hypothetical protein [Sporichthya sp.]